MARRSDHSREELYELAIQAARKIIEQDGYRALTARNVADAIGYSPGTLYNLFNNLDDMVMHVNGRTLDDLHDRFAGVTPLGEAERDIGMLLDCYLGFIEEHPGLWHMLLNYTLTDGYEIPDWYDRKIQRLLALVEGALAPLFGAAEEEELAGATRVLWAGLHGITALSEAGKLNLVTGQSVREMAVSLVTNYVAGIRARHSGS